MCRIIRKEGKTELRRYPRNLLFTEERTVGRPGIIGWIGYETGSDGIHVYVAKQRKEVAVYINEFCSVTPFEEVAAGIKLPVARTSVPLGDPLDDCSQRKLTDLHYRMQMIRHPAEGVDANAEAANYIGNDAVQLRSVGGLAEQGLTVIASQNDVVVPARHVQSRSAWHPCRSTLPPG
jgi:hypothetical protein